LLVVLLLSPLSANQWKAYHDIRKRILFDDRGLSAAYDANHPDDTSPGNHAVLLEIDGNYVGVARVDINGSHAQLRRVAIDRTFQRRGYGREMISKIIDFCRKEGINRISSSVAADAVGFYRKCGFVGGDSEIEGKSVPMHLDLAIS